MDNEQELFHKIIEFFPESKISAFEPDNELCKKLNKNSIPGLIYYPIALGKKKETRKFYRTEHPACSSLYEPNDKLIKNFNNLESAQLEKVEEIQTISLDEFIKNKNLGKIDFIKIDVQGAELDIFKGAKECLNNVIFLISEVEFIELYKNQPLFGEICNFLKQYNLNFHRFFNISGHTLKPIMIDNNPDITTQMLWADVLFIKNIMELNKLNSEELIKLAIFSGVYGSPDLSLISLYEYDKKNKTNLVEKAAGKEMAQNIINYRSKIK